MRELDERIALLIDGARGPARLRVLQVPDAWYAVVWESEERFWSFSAVWRNNDSPWAKASDQLFMEQVREAIAWTSTGEVVFEYEYG